MVIFQLMYPRASRTCRIEQQDAWVRGQAAQETSPFWMAVGLSLRQYDGVYDGYRARRRAANGAIGHMSAWEFQFLTANGEQPMY